MHQLVARIVDEVLRRLRGARLVVHEDGEAAHAVVAEAPVEDGARRGGWADLQPAQALHRARVRPLRDDAVAEGHAQWLAERVVGHARGIAEAAKVAAQAGRPERVM
jgi:hypothetical protein